MWLLGWLCNNCHVHLGDVWVDKFFPNFITILLQTLDSSRVDGISSLCIDTPLFQPWPPFPGPVGQPRPSHFARQPWGLLIAAWHQHQRRPAAPRCQDDLIGEDAAGMAGCHQFPSRLELPMPGILLRKPYIKHTSK